MKRTTLTLLAIALLGCGGPAADRTQNDQPSNGDNGSVGGPSDSISGGPTGSGGGSVDGGSVDGGSVDGGSVDGGSVDGGGLADGGSADGNPASDPIICLDTTVGQNSAGGPAAPYCAFFQADSRYGIATGCIELDAMPNHTDDGPLYETVSWFGVPYYLYTNCHCSGHPDSSLEPGTHHILSPVGDGIWFDGPTCSTTKYVDRGDAGWEKIAENYPASPCRAAVPPPANFKSVDNFVFGNELLGGSCEEQDSIAKCENAWSMSNEDQPNGLMYYEISVHTQCMWRPLTCANDPNAPKLADCLNAPLPADPYYAGGDPTVQTGRYGCVRSYFKPTGPLDSGWYPGYEVYGADRKYTDDCH